MDCFFELLAVAVPKNSRIFACFWVNGKFWGGVKMRGRVAWYGTHSHENTSKVNLFF